MTTEAIATTTIKFSDLPALGADFEGGKFAGLTTRKDGTHAAVILLPHVATELTWKKAIAWAKKLKAELPSRPVASLLSANLKSDLRPQWHWTSEELDASYAWGCYFDTGGTYDDLKSYGGSAVAVRLIPVTA